MPMATQNKIAAGSLLTDETSEFVVLFTPHLLRVDVEAVENELSNIIGCEGIIRAVSSNWLSDNLDLCMKTPKVLSAASPLSRSKKTEIAHPDESGEDKSSPAEVKRSVAVYEAVVGMCRKACLLHPRATLLSLKEQQQALLLCLARRNKEANKDFGADASDFQAAWNVLKKEAREQLTCGRTVVKLSENMDPALQDLYELVSSYKAFISSCNYLDFLSLAHIFSTALGAANNPIHRVLSSKVLVVEGCIDVMERLMLLPLIRRAAYLYTSAPGSCSRYKVQDHMSEDSARNSEAKPVLPAEFSISSSEHSIQFTRVDISHQSADEILDSLFGTAPNAACLTPGTRHTRGIQPNASLPSPRDLSFGTPVSSKVSGSRDLCTSNLKSSVRTPRANACRSRGGETLLYIRQVMVCQLRLLLNTRDEMALAVNCSLPGTALSQAAFADIKQEARRINMPMFQTILSVVQKRRLGGSGYQLPSNSQILAHVAPLTNFVDHINKLTTIVEDESCPTTAANKILTSIKRYVVQQCTGVHSKKCPIKVSTIEAVHKNLLETLDSCLSTPALITENKTNPCNAGKQAGLPYPVLGLLQRLCDRCTGECSTADDGAVALVSACADTNDIVLTQASGSPRLVYTPLRVPSLLSLYRTPPPCQDDPEDVIVEEKLSVRYMKRNKATPARSKRHQSCLAWAPDNLSPLQVIASPVPLSQSGVGSLAQSRISSHDVLEMIADLPDSSLAKGDMDAKERLKNIPKCSNNKQAPAVKRSSKRSLLSDMSGIAKDAEKNKKSKIDSGPVSAKRNKNSQQLPSCQKSITSFFKSK
ncbi:uncharacterized protein LOC108679690 isoform X2 [Hyalella azteca]|uniref:PCNA-interacting partner n=1 Tax=Hyalella azteca TaxID=294128 RepID=A0A979FSU7_HYAAZ|nr:uncharacterized protein LOC108679690 isoform X2 [Hyalella azteca]